MWNAEYVTFSKQKAISSTRISKYPFEGVGKSYLSERLCLSNSSLKHININDLAKQNKFFLGYDEENQCDILDDDAINDYLNDTYFKKSSLSGLIIDYHSAGIIPDNSFIHGIFVLRCSNDILFERLKSGNYSEKKAQENIQSEVFHGCLNDAREAYDESIVYELINETENDLKNNTEYLLEWIDKWPLN